MRILHVIPSLAPDRGGPSRSVIGMLRAQASLGADVQVVSGWVGQKPELSLENVQIEYGQLAQFRFEIPSSELMRCINREVASADIVHLHSIWTGTISYAGWRCRVEGKPTVLSPRGMLDSHNMRYRKFLKILWLRLIERANLAGLAGFHFQDETEREGCTWLGEAIEKPYLIQPNGLDMLNLDARLAAFESSPFSENIRHQKTGIVILVYLGRLHPIKGLDMQVKLLADLREAGINAHLHLIGPDDGATDSIINLAVKLGVTPFLHFLGAIYNDERLHWLKKADAVLLTSHYECNSNSAAETMAVGGVLVATDTCHVDRPAQLSAVCVVPREQARLFDAVRELVTVPDKAQQIRQAASDYVLQHLDWTAHAREMLAFYDKLIYIT